MSYKTRIDNCMEHEGREMRKIVDYYIVCSTFNLPNTHINSIEAKVKKLIKKGWELYGKPFEAAGHLCQAMVKYEEEKEQGHGIDRLQTFLNKDILDILDDQLSNQTTKMWKTTVTNRFKKKNISKLKDLKDSWDIKKIFSDNAARNIFGEIIDQLLKFSKQDDKK